MYCAKCGGEVHAGLNFCNRCGAPVAVAAMTPAPPPIASVASSAPTAASSQRVAHHIKILGVLWIAFSLLRLFGGFAMLGMSGMRFAMYMPVHFNGWLGHMMSALGVIGVILGLAGVAAGWGLLDKAHWARVLAIVIGIISLINVPFGTAIGIYTLWVLMPTESETEYRRLSSPA